MRALSVSQLTHVVGGVIVPPVGFQPNLQSINIGPVLSGPLFTNNINPRFGSGLFNIRIVGTSAVLTGLAEEC